MNVRTKLRGSTKRDGANEILAANVAQNEQNWLLHEAQDPKTYCNQKAHLDGRNQGLNLVQTGVINQRPEKSLLGG